MRTVCAGAVSMSGVSACWHMRVIRLNSVVAEIWRKGARQFSRVHNTCTVCWPIWQAARAWSVIGSGRVRGAREVQADGVRAQALHPGLNLFQSVLSMLHHPVAYVEYVCVRRYIWGLCVPGQGTASGTTAPEPSGVAYDSLHGLFNNASPEWPASL